MSRNVNSHNGLLRLKQDVDFYVQQVLSSDEHFHGIFSHGISSFPRHVFSQSTLRKKLLKVRHRSKIIGGGGLERAYLEMWWIKTRGPSPPFAKKLTDPTLNVG